jgi:hypothetical protein
MLSDEENAVQSLAGCTIYLSVKQLHESCGQGTISVHIYLYEHLVEAHDGMGPGPHCLFVHHLKMVHSMWLIGVTPSCARAHEETCEAYKIVICRSAIQEVYEQ